MSKQEDKIKTYLQLLGDHQDLRATSFDFKTSFDFFSRARAYKPFNEFNEITDWQDNREPSFGSSLPHLTKSKQLRSHVSSIEIPPYRSSLLKDQLHRRHEDSSFISPVTIKFSALNGNSSPRKSQLLYHRILHNEDGRKIQNPEKLRNLLNRINPKQEEVRNIDSPPKTERCSGILRLLKRREKMRIYHKKKDVPEALKGIRLH